MTVSLEAVGGKRDLRCLLGVEELGRRKVRTEVLVLHLDALDSGRAGGVAVPFSSTVSVASNGANEAWNVPAR